MSNYLTHTCVYAIISFTVQHLTANLETKIPELHMYWSNRGWMIEAKQVVILWYKDITQQWSFFYSKQMLAVKFQFFIPSKLKQNHASNTLEKTNLNVFYISHLQDILADLIVNVFTFSYEQIATDHSLNLGFLHRPRYCISLHVFIYSIDSCTFTIFSIHNIF